MLIDSHAHIDDQKFNEDRKAVLENARAAGVEVRIRYTLTSRSDRAERLALGHIQSQFRGIQAGWIGGEKFGAGTPIMGQQP